MPEQQISSGKLLGEFLASKTKPKCLLYYANDHPQSSYLHDAMKVMVTEFGNYEFGYCDVVTANAVLKGAELKSLPQVWIIDEQSSKVKIVEGTDPGEIMDCLKEDTASFNNAEKLDSSQLLAKVHRHAEENYEEFVGCFPIVVIGPCTPESQALCDRISGWGIKEFEYVDSDEMKELAGMAMEKFSCALPIIISSGKYVDPGNSELEQILLKTRDEAKQGLQSRLEQLTKKAEYVLFMKGTKEAPFCKFSKAVVNTLNSYKIDFDYFNIFEDPQVRDGMKAFSAWPTFPQFYADGNFVGGGDIISEFARKANGDPQEFRKLLKGSQ